MSAWTMWPSPSWRRPMESRRRSPTCLFSEEAIDRSVGDLVDRVPVPHYSKGYDSWSRSFAACEARVFTITVGEAVECMEVAINEGTPLDD